MYDDPVSPGYMSTLSMYDAQLLVEQIKTLELKLKSLKNDFDNFSYYGAREQMIRYFTERKLIYFDDYDNACFSGESVSNLGDNHYIKSIINRVDKLEVNLNQNIGLMDKPKYETNADVEEKLHTLEIKINQCKLDMKTNKVKAFQDCEGIRLKLLDRIREYEHRIELILQVINDKLDELERKVK